jgi:integrase
LRRAAGGAGAAKRAIRTLSSVFAYAIDCGYLHANPAHGVKLQPDRQRVCYLGSTEANRLGQALARREEQGLTPNAVSIIRLLLLTGARRNEISELKWCEIDFERGYLRLNESKTGLSIRPLSSAALQLLRKLPRQHSVWVFPSETGDGPYVGLPKAWRKIRAEAGLDHLRLHDLRHSFASFGVTCGLSLPVIGGLLGHTQASTTQRYAHLSNDTARQAANSLALFINNALCFPQTPRRTATSP